MTAPEMELEMEKAEKRYTVAEEIINSVSHGVGAMLGVAALVLCIVVALLYGDGYSLAGGIIFGISLIVMYSMSALYHAFTNEKVKKIFRIFDHNSIFLLIAGTYTPFCLVSLMEYNPVLAWTLFGITWGMGILSIVLNSIDLKKFKVFSFISYIVMGWLIIIVINPLRTAIAPAGIWLLVAGGITYTVGIIFYVLKKVRFMHCIWHFFVLAGSILHFLAILLYVLPNN